MSENHLLEGLKVVTAEEMARLEQLAYSDGASDETFMENAGKGIAETVIAFMLEHETANRVTLLAGKGNNGGDAYVTGCYLLEKGRQVSAIHLFPLEESSRLCHKMCLRFQESGGSVAFHREGEQIV